MAKISLKSLIEKDGFAAILLEIFIQSSCSYCLKDSNGKILLSDASNQYEFHYPVIANGEEIGTISGGKNILEFANLLNFLAQKEVEKKKLGSEVLNLYKEINIIFNFSEKLASTINTSTICTITLNEARNVINVTQGVVILSDDDTTKLSVISSTDKLFFGEQKINENLSMLKKIILSGQSEIVTDTSDLIKLKIVFPDVKSLIYAALKVNNRVIGAIILASNQEESYTAGHLKLLTTLAFQSSAAIESALLFEKNIKESKEREEAMRLIYEVTGKFVPYEFIKSLGHNLITDVKLGDQVEKVVTVLFSDIRDYTTFSEQMTPEQNFKFVCSFNERMGPIIRQNHGFINQYLGDAIMAIFPRNAADALQAAIEMQKEVEELNLVRRTNNQAAIKIGIGMHTGPLIMGITGDLDRMDATTISDTVNIASRLESLTKYYKASIILSDACLKQINEIYNFHLRYLGLVQLKGKNMSLHIHECFSCNSEAEIIKKQKTLSTFNEAIDQLLNNSFDAAIKSFQLIVDDNPEDQTTVFFLDAATKNLENSTSGIRSGVVEMTSK